MLQGAQLIDNEGPRLPRRLRLCYSIGHVLNDVCASMWFTYLLVFFHLVLRWPAEMAGIVMLIGQVADAIATPFVGLQSDSRGIEGTCWYRYGQRKIWHLFGKSNHSIIFHPSREPYCHLFRAIIPNMTFDSHYLRRNR